MYCFYIIYSAALDRYYKGHTEEMQKRLEQHLQGKSTYTSKATDWKLVYLEEHKTRGEAYARERQVKAKKSRTYIERLISGSSAG